MIPPEVSALLRTGVSVVVGTRDASLMPECTRAWGNLAHEDGTSVTIFLTETISRKTIQNLHENGHIAISCARPTDHQACQLKGRLRGIRQADAQDRGLPALAKRFLRRVGRGRDPGRVSRRLDYRTRVGDRHRGDRTVAETNSSSMRS